MMFYPLKHPLFLGACALFLANQMLEFFGVFIPFVHSYLDDLLVMPIFLALGLTGMRGIYRNPNGVLKVSHILVATLWISFLFEYWFPSYKANHYADAWDVLAYFSGSLLFYFVGVPNQWVVPFRFSRKPNKKYTDAA
jgi:hypothetical protein